MDRDWRGSEALRRRLLKNGRRQVNDRQRLSQREGEGNKTHANWRVER